jgi:hypothetical protein
LRADEAGIECLQVECAEKQIVSIEGLCSTCLDYTYPDDEGKACISDVCEENQI